MKSYLEQVIQHIPLRFHREIKNEDTVFELRLRPEKSPVIISKYGKQPCSSVLSKGEFEAIFLALSGGNCYKHEHTLTEGYFRDRYGGRCGVGCEVRSEGDRVHLIRVVSLNIRIPRFVSCAADELSQYFLSKRARVGMLIFAPPRTGKTTVIRALAGALGGGCNELCVCVVDERGEFDLADYPYSTNLDILTGYPKAKGIEIAVRSLGADVIICDEIGNHSDRDDFSILSASGVPIIATVHASSVDELMGNEVVCRLCEKGVFPVLAQLLSFDHDVARFAYFGDGL